MRLLFYLLSTLVVASRLNLPLIKRDAIQLIKHAPVISSNLITLQSLDYHLYLMRPDQKLLYLSPIINLMYQRLIISLFDDFQGFIWSELEDSGGWWSFPFNLQEEPGARHSSSCCLLQSLPPACRTSHEIGCTNYRIRDIFILRSWTICCITDRIRRACFSLLAMGMCAK